MKLTDLSQKMCNNNFQSLYLCLDKGLVYDDIYPEIADDYKSLLESSLIEEEKIITSPNPKLNDIKNSDSFINNISNDTMMLVDKLERHGKWGKHKDPVNRYNKQLNIQNLADSINELAEIEWLCEEGKRGCEGHAFSLNSSNKQKIQEALERYRMPCEN